MTKDELNVILKKEDMYLSPVADGTFNNVFYVFNNNCVVVEFNGVDFIFSHDYGHGYWKKIVEALVEYANTPIEERKPKPQLYNVVIGRDLENVIYTAWVKNGDLEISNYVREPMLYGDPRFKFTKDDIEKYKSRLSSIEQSIVDLGTFPVGTDYKKEFAHD